MDSYRGSSKYLFVKGIATIVCLLVIGCVSSGSKSVVLTEDPDLLSHVSSQDSQEKTKVQKKTREEKVKTAEQEKPAADTKKKWTLQDCIAHALENNDGIKNLTAKTMGVKGEIIEAWSAYLPTAKFKYAHGKNNEAGEFDFYQIKGKTLIWDSGKTSSKVKQLKAKKYIYREARRQERLNVIYQIRKSFYQLIFARYKVAALSTNLEDAKLREQNAKGSGEVELLEARAAVAEAEQELFEGSNEYILAKQHLNHMMGRSLKAPLEVEGELNFRQIPLHRDKLIKRAMESSPTLGMKDKAIDKAKYDKEEARRHNYPNIHAMAFFEYRDTDRELSFTNERDKLFHGEAYGVGVEVELPLFQGIGVAYGKGKKADKELKNAKRNFKSAKREVEFAVESVCNKMEEAIRGIYSAQLSSEYYGKILDRVESGFTQGTYKQKDVIKAKKEAAHARVKLMQSIMNYKVAKAKLDKVMGILDAK